MSYITLDQFILTHKQNFFTSLFLMYTMPSVKVESKLIAPAGSCFACLTGGACICVFEALLLIVLIHTQASELSERRQIRVRRLLWRFKICVFPPQHMLFFLQLPFVLIPKINAIMRSFPSFLNICNLFMSESSVVWNLCVKLSPATSEM